MNSLNCQLLYDRLQYLFEDFTRATLISTDHETIYLKYKSLSDIGTLAQCAEVCHSYLHLQDGDIVITNDPYSGGSLLSSPTLVLGIGNRNYKGQIPAEFLVACRITFNPKIGPAKTIDDEGLRIPPSPYYNKGTPNKAIVDALKNHPQLPPDFTETIQLKCEQLLQLRHILKSDLVNGRLDLSKNTIKSYLNTTSRAFEKKMEDLAEGSRTIEIEITEKEVLKLKLDHIDGHFHFNFTGTSEGQDIFLTDSVTIGTVIGATLSMLKEAVPINSGIFSRFDVKAPRGTFLNAAFPKPLLLGHTDGTSILAGAVVKCLSLISKKHVAASSGTTACQYQLKFSSGKIFADRLAPGIGATALKKGASGLSLWNLESTNTAIEKLESLYPLQIQGTGFRSESGGSGQLHGGHGMVKRIKLLEDCELAWTFAISPHNPDGANGGKSAHNAEIMIQSPEGKKEELPQSGTRKIKKGSILTIMSPGGGGYGTAQS